MLYTEPVAGDESTAGENRSVSIRDVAAAAGVSVATVSRALGPNAETVQMRPETRARVLRTSEELGYRPNDLARSLLRQRTSVIGLIVPDISNAYYAGLVRGVQDTAAAAGYRVVLCNTDREAQRLGKHLDTLVESRVDGVVIAGGAGDASLDSRAFRQYRTQVVLVGRHSLDGPSVQIDNTAAAERMAEHVLGLGHERVGFLAGPLASRTVQDRIAGYRKALAARGIHDEIVLEGQFTEESGYAGAGELLSHHQRPTAIICANDRIAVGALAGATDRGVGVPEDLSVVGFDNVSLSSYLRPSLTTVDIPTYGIGSSAAGLLLGRLDGDPGNEHVVLPTRLVLRDSCGAPPA